MGIDVHLYETPKLTTEIKTGMLVEALMGSEATKIAAFGNPIASVDPTNIFGYVRGTVIEKYREDDNDEPIRGHEYLAGIEMGQIVVERIIPPMNPVDDNNYLIPQFWNPNMKPVVLAVGEIRGETEIQDDIANVLAPGSVCLSPADLVLVRTTLGDYMQKRGQKEYLFSTPDGKEYRLHEIVLGLREIKR